MFSRHVWRPLLDALRWLLPSYREWARGYEKRIAQIPHLRDYEGAKPSLWLPFVMDCMEPNIATDAINSDPLGFRYSIGKDGQKYSPHSPVKEPVSLFVGGSSAFGVGATSDRNTVPSILAARHGEPWYNLAVRGFNISQNLMQFMVFRSVLGDVRRIVIFAGWNEVHGFVMAPLFTRYYGSFHGFMQYFQTMNDDKVLITRKKIEFPERWMSLVMASVNKEKTKPYFIEQTRNMLSNWKFVSDALGADLIFLVQPISFCCPHVPTDEERRLFDAKTNVKSIKRTLAPFRDWFVGVLEDECTRLGIRFQDCNATFGKDVNLPLFIDPFHLTDHGNAAVADIIDTHLSASKD